jgi:hypothetical protein
MNLYVLLLHILPLLCQFVRSLFFVENFQIFLVQVGYT